METMARTKPAASFVHRWVQGWHRRAVSGWWSLGWGGGPGFRLERERGAPVRQAGRAW